MKKNKIKPIEQSKTESKLFNSFIEYILFIVILAVAFGIGYWIEIRNNMYNSQKLEISVTPSKAPTITLSAKTTKTPAPTETPIATQTISITEQTCERAKYIESILASDNLNKLEELYEKQEIICSDEEVNGPFPPDICDGIANNEKRFGYILGDANTEGNLYAFNKLSDELKNYLDSKGPFYLFGLRQNNIFEQSPVSILYKNADSTDSIVIALSRQNDNKIYSIVKGPYEGDSGYYKYTLCEAMSPTPNP